jgi:DNA polymerase-3 subunit beta
MNVRVSAEALSERLKPLLRVIQKDPVLTILENIKLEVSQDRIRLTASDSHHTIMTSLQAVAEEEFVMALPAFDLAKTVDRLGDTDIIIDYDASSFKATIKRGRNRYKLSGENPVDYLEFPQIEGEGIALNEAQLQALGEASSYTDPVEGGVPSFSSVKLGPDIVATNGVKIYCYQAGINGDALIYHKAAVIADAILQESATITIHERNVLITDGEYTIISRLVDERYVDYQALLNIERNIQVKLEIASFLEHLSLVEIYGQRQDIAGQVALIKCLESSLELYSSDMALDKECQEFVEEGFQLNGEPIAFALPVKQLKQALKTISAYHSWAVIHIASYREPVKITPDADIPVQVMVGCSLADNIEEINESLQQTDIVDEL